MIKKFFGLMLVLLVVSNIKGQVQIQKVEASFIANFMRYIKWPEQESMKSFTIGVYGKNQMIFKELSNSINGRNVGLAIIKVIEVETLEEIKSCQTLFIPKGKAGRIKNDISTLESFAVMPITEEQEYMPDFAMINFKVKDSKLTFQLNSGVAQKKKITVSSKLLQMASN